MLGIYKQSVAKIQHKNASKCNHMIGHDRFCNCATKRHNAEFTKRKKLFKARSVTELNTRMSEFGPPRSQSSDQVKAYATALNPNGTTRTYTIQTEKAPLISKMESLAKLFSCTSVNEENIQRQNGAYSYTALEPDSHAAHERLEFELKARERAQNVCVQYLKSNSRYTLIHQLNDIGSRVDKHWFLVRDNCRKTERLLTIVPRGTNCPVQCDPGTRKTILDLFVALQHPYIYPVLELNFADIGNRSYVIVTLPFNERGSLKDLIYKSQWQEDWSQKYSQRSTGLPISQIQRLGRQVLEALLFLRDRGFPPCSHMHSGNIIIQNGVARLTGLENTLLGYTSRIHPIVWSRAQTEQSAIDTLCFGHVLFEMCAGYELDTPQPTPGHLLDLHHYPQVLEVLHFIFENPEMKLPSIEQLLLCDLFRNIDLREMRNQAQSTQFFKTGLTQPAKELLTEIKKSLNGRRRKQTLNSTSSADMESSCSSQREKSDASDVEDEDYGGDVNSDSETVASVLLEGHRDLSLHLQTRSSSRLLYSSSSSHQR